MRWLFAIAVLGACGSSELAVRSYVARGWEGKLDRLLGPSQCVPMPGEPLLVPAGDHWRASAIGHAHVPCTNGALELDIGEPAWLAIAVPAVIGAKPTDVTLAAYDAAGRELELGDGAVTWTVTGQARERTTSCEHHDDMDFLCGAIEVMASRPASTYVAGTAAGSATITARFGGLVATRTVTVTL